jgi:hypothetical protein
MNTELMGERLVFQGGSAGEDDPSAYRQGLCGLIPSDA